MAVAVEEDVDLLNLPWDRRGCVDDHEIVDIERSGRGVHTDLRLEVPRIVAAIGRGPVRDPRPEQAPQSDDRDCNDRIRPHCAPLRICYLVWTCCCTHGAMELALV